MVPHPAIDANNRAVGALRNGDLFTAFRILSDASAMLAEHTHEGEEKNPDNSKMQFRWCDCSAALLRRLPTLFRTSHGGSSSFLCYKFLLVTLPDNGDNASDTSDANAVNKSCPCAFSWVLWYNLAILCALIGAHLEAKGSKLLDHAYQVLLRVMERIESETNQSYHWVMLRMSVLNNQACICKELSRRELMVDRLRDLAKTLISARSHPSGQRSDLRGFYWTLRVLNDKSSAAAAA